VLLGPITLPFISSIALAASDVLLNFIYTTPANFKYYKYGNYS